MSRLINGEALEDKIRNFRGDVIRSRKHLILARLQFLESEVAVGTHAGVVERDVLAHSSNIDTMLTSPAFATIASIVVIGSVHTTFYDGSAVCLAIVDEERRNLCHRTPRQIDRSTHGHLFARGQGGIGKHGIVSRQQILKLIHSVGIGFHIVAEKLLIAIDDEDIGLGSHHSVGSQSVVVVGMMHEFHIASHRPRAAFARAFVACGKQ